MDFGGGFGSILLNFCCSQTGAGDGSGPRAWKLMQCDKNSLGQRRKRKRADVDEVPALCTGTVLVAL